MATTHLPHIDHSFYEKYRLYLDVKVTDSLLQVLFLLDLVDWNSANRAHNALNAAFRSRLLTKDR